MTYCRTVAWCARSTALMLMLAAAPVAATTIPESGVGGGDFSNDWTSPTSIGFGFDHVQGTAGSSDYDYLVFTGMTPGAQTVSLSFNMPLASNPLGLAGGTVQYGTVPFTSATGGSSAGGFFLTSYAPTQMLTLNLGAGFGGTLYLGITALIGQNLGYSIGVPGNAPPPPVPLPASVGLLGGALAGFGAFGAARRSKRRAA